MYRKRVLVTIFSFVLVFLVFLLFTEDNSSNDMITKMIAISSERASFNVEDNFEIIEYDTSIDDDIDTEEEAISLQGDTNTLDNDFICSFLSLVVALLNNSVNSLSTFLV